MSDLILVETGQDETGRWTKKTCKLCGYEVEIKVFEKVRIAFTEVNLLKDEEGNPYIFDEKTKKKLTPTKKQLEQATRNYKVGDEYQVFGYSEGGRHTCR